MKAYEKIGKKLQEAREEAGLSQDELARKLGCTQASLSNYELGKRRLYLADLQRIGQLLGKQVTYFLDDSEEDQPIPDDLTSILKEQYLQEILIAARDLKISQRKSVLDYIRWQRGEGGSN
jgi:transcriptional regulator with XRE-family HTH domain